jgi:hypothetical protein
MTVPCRVLCYRGRQTERDGRHRQEGGAMEDLGTDEDGGVDISITDEVQSDMDLTGQKPDDGAVEQETV